MNGGRRCCVRWLLASLVISVAGACSGDGSRCTALPGNLRYCLQTTAAMAPFEAQQSVAVTFGDRRETMIAQLESDASGMRFALLTPFGQKLAQMDFDNERFRAKPPSMPGLDPLALLALVQIANWPLDSVRAGLAGTATIAEVPGMGAIPVARTLARDGKALMEITYTRGRPPLGDVAIELPAAGVVLSIVNLEVSDSDD